MGCKGVGLGTASYTVDASTAAPGPCLAVCRGRSLFVRGLARSALDALPAVNSTADNQWGERKMPFLNFRPVLVPLSSRLYEKKGTKRVLEYSRLALWDSLMFGRVLEC